MKTSDPALIHKNPSALSSAAQTSSTTIAFSTDPPSSSAEHFARQAETIRQRSRSLVSQLSYDQHQRLIEWLESGATLDEVCRRVAAPPPEGFGIHTHRTTLHRISVQLRALPSVSAVADMIDQVEQYEAMADLSQLSRVQRTISSLLHKHAFHLASEKPGSPVLPRIVGAIQKLSALENTRQKLALEAEKLRQPAAPRRHHVNLNIVRPNPQPAFDPSAPPPPNAIPAAADVAD